MYAHDITIRVKYGETDRMGYLYYGNYAMYYEVGRVETMRSLGVTYKDMEDSGIALPVLELKSKYIRPALYDEEIRVRTIVRELPSVRLVLDYELFKDDDLINIGHTTLVFFDTNRRRPCKAPDYFIEKLTQYF